MTGFSQGGKAAGPARLRDLRYFETLGVGAANASPLASPSITITPLPTFRVTKKLANAFDVKLSSAPTAEEKREHEWFADLFWVEGKKCVIWVHRSTLLMFARPPPRGRPELREFDGLFRYEFRTATASMALPEVLLDRFGVDHPETYAPTDDQSILGSMLDYRKMFEVLVKHEGGLTRAPIAAINAKLNDTPMSVLGMERAADVIDSLVERDGQSRH